MVRALRPQPQQTPVSQRRSPRLQFLTPPRSSNPSALGSIPRTPISNQPNLSGSRSSGSEQIPVRGAESPISEAINATAITFRPRHHLVRRPRFSVAADKKMLRSATNIYGRLALGVATIQHAVEGWRQVANELEGSKQQEFEVVQSSIARLKRMVNNCLMQCKAGLRAYDLLRRMLLTFRSVLLKAKGVLAASLPRAQSAQDVDIDVLNRALDSDVFMLLPEHASMLRSAKYECTAAMKLKLPRLCLRAIHTYGAFLQKIISSGKGEILEEILTPRAPDYSQPSPLQEQQHQTRPGSRDYEALQFQLFDVYMERHLDVLAHRRIDYERNVDLDHDKYLTQLRDQQRRLNETRQSKIRIARLAGGVGRSARQLIDNTMSSLMLNTPEIVRFRHLWSHHRDVIVNQLGRIQNSSRRNQE